MGTCQPTESVPAVQPGHLVWLGALLCAAAGFVTRRRLG